MSAFKIKKKKKVWLGSENFMSDGKFQLLQHLWMKTPLTDNEELHWVLVEVGF